jgi:phage protein D/phage baseplate assembly protein gpV
LSPATTTAKLSVLLEGVPLNPEVGRLLVSADIETSLWRPASMTLAFRGTRTLVLDTGGIQIGGLISAEMSTGAEAAPLFLGEVTAVEIDYGPAGNLTLVRALDLSSRLMRGTLTRAFVDSTASEAVLTLLGEHEVPPGEVTSTAAIYPQLTQANISSWLFIQQLAAAYGYVARLSMADGTFTFAPPRSVAEAPPPAMSFDQPLEPGQLVLGLNVLRLRARASAAEQTASVGATGWNPLTGESVRGDWANETTMSRSDDPELNGAALGGLFGADLFLDSDRPLASPTAAVARAKALGQELAQATMWIEAECLGNPVLEAGRPITLSMAGLPFDGSYVLTGVRHRYAPGAGGYTTWVTVGTRRQDGLLALGGGPTGAIAGAGRLPAIACGRVDNVDDPLRLGRVRVRFEWLGPMYVSTWARTVQPGAGSGRGNLFLPEVGDEVLVAFDRGDPDHPYVLGNLYNSFARPDPPAQIAGGLVTNRQIITTSHQTISFSDDPDALGITMRVGDETCSIQLDQTNQRITVKSAGELVIEAGGMASIKANGDLTIQAAGAVSIQADGEAALTAKAALTLQGNGGAELLGADVTIAGDESVTVSGASIMLG